MSAQKDFGIYGILTDPLVGYEKLAAVMVDNGMKYIQLRMKEWGNAVVRDMARRLRRIIAGDSLFIVNDDPIIARDAGADGVHLGQDDISFEKAREILGDEAIIGLSTHNVAQTQAACAKGPDYIGVGPVYATPTKKIPDPVIGLFGMRNMMAHATCPAVAIGGIDLSNLPSVLKHGARNVCAVRCINRAQDPDAVIKEMKRTMATLK
jgi:thiamine-phosphate pyrophosphorylase